MSLQAGGSAKDATHVRATHAITRARVKVKGGGAGSTPGRHPRWFIKTAKE